MSERARNIRARALARTLLPALLLAVACSNDPYPPGDAAQKIYYTVFREAHRTLDPAEAYNVSAHKVTGSVYDSLLEYHYLKRPYELGPGLARAVPEPQRLEDGRVRYRFEMRSGIGFGPDPCFELGGAGRRSREATSADVAFQLMRLADPALKVQVTDAFSALQGFREFRERLISRRKLDPRFAALPAHKQYAALGGMEGVRTPSRYELEITLARPYPQILYWFAMEFTTPVAWEAVEFYDGNEGRDRFADHPVGTGPFYVREYNKHLRLVLERNPHWYGLRHPEALGARYPERGAPGDAEKGLLAAAYRGRPLPFLDRIEIRLEKESIPRFNKFLQGYYDASSIIKESFDQVIQADRLSPQMSERGIRLARSVAPSVFYLGINMEDAVLGAPAGERGRKLRQALSLAVSSEPWIELFLNGRGVPAQTPLPPVIFGYNPDYRNPYRQQQDAKRSRARELLIEAGYPGGIDPDTGSPLRLSFDTYTLNSQQLLERQYFVDEWRKIGVDVKLQATTYNEFQAKVERLAYQIFFWGWSADYPDPENFLFLLTCDMRRSTAGGPNTSNFCDQRYEKLFAEMALRGNDAERQRLIGEMVKILEEERPWIELYHVVDYQLSHGWLHNVKPFGMSHPQYKYYDIEPERRAALRLSWNEPVTWPAYALAGLVLAALVPGVRTFLRERQ